MERLKAVLLQTDPVLAVASVVALAAALLMVTRRNPMYAAVWMLFTFLALAVAYLRLGAPFLAAMHVLVYTGAILVLFLFVIMLLNLKPEELGQETPLPLRLGAAVLCGGLFVLLAAAILRDPASTAPPPPAPAAFGSVHSVGTDLFTTYALPFELASALILAAIFGGVVLAKRKL
ncbi:MAG TPA: NADH-quinone oxidoreductase subunit J [Planctomycetota bacterium]|nr:NADH-quinone oxidoreductase subunit J [Planctomycetota bacterium]